VLKHYLIMKGSVLFQCLAKAFVCSAYKFVFSTWTFKYMDWWEQLEFRRHFIAIFPYNQLVQLLPYFTET